MTRLLAVYLLTAGLFLVCACGEGAPGSSRCADASGCEPEARCAGERCALGGVREIGCGDGVVARDEQCDDGGVLAGDGCSPECGAEPGWLCDQAAPSWCVPACGDGVVVGAESCDDGAQRDGDGCSASCSVQPGWSCMGAPSRCTPACGDGALAGSEACDDGDAANGDGCSAACVVEAGWSCDGARPTLCVAHCGDGLLVGDEGCDDGGSADGDGCSARCAVEPGFRCAPGAPSRCEALDAEPDDFSFAPLDDAEPESAYVSGAVTLSGFLGAIDVVVSGEPSATLVLNDVFTSTRAARARAGDRLAVSLIAAAAFATEVSASVTAGVSSSATWRVTTRAQDTAPAAFALADVRGAAPSSEVTSEEVVLGAFDGPLEASCGGACSAIAHNGAWGGTSVAGLMPGDTLALRLTAASDYDTPVVATVTVGSASLIAWSVTTRAPPCVSGTAVFTAVGQHAFVMPAGCRTATVKLWGAGGGGSANASGVRGDGGGGGFAQRTFTVTAGAALAIYVAAGGQSSAGGAGGAGGWGFGTGGNGQSASGSGTGGAGGGGASAVVLDGSYVAIAAGGGGARGKNLGGAGGGAYGQDGQTQYWPDEPWTRGRGGSQGGFGEGGKDGGGFACGQDGQGHDGGDAGRCNCPSGGPGAGGGGGGYWGGGGGAVDCTWTNGSRTGNSGSGGGGSSRADDGVTVAGNGSSPGNASDPSYGSGAGLGGVVGAHDGYPGRVVVLYSE